MRRKALAMAGLTLTVARRARYARQVGAALARLEGRR